MFVSKKPLPLSMAFCESDDCYPALKFASDNGLRDIAQFYTIPNGMTAFAYSEEVWRRDRWREDRENWNLPKFIYQVIDLIDKPDFSKGRWKMLVDLNPCLKEVDLNIEDRKELRNAIAGVRYGFNVDDINFFLEQIHIGEGHAGRNAENIPVHADRVKRIFNAAVNKEIGWVMSPKTAIEVERQFVELGLL